MIPQHNSAMPIRNPANYGSAREAQSAGIVLAARGAWQRRGDRAGAAGLHIAAIAERRIDHDPRRPSVGWQRGAASHGPRAAAWPLRIACHRGIDPRGNATGLTRRWGGAGLGVVGNADWRRWRSSRQHPRSMARRSTGRALVPVLVQCRLGTLLAVPVPAVPALEGIEVDCPGVGAGAGPVPLGLEFPTEPAEPAPVDPADPDEAPPALPALPPPALPELLPPPLCAITSAVLPARKAAVRNTRPFCLECMARSLCVFGGALERATSRARARFPAGTGYRAER